MMAEPAPVAAGELGRDALCELVNIGCGNALASLSRLLGGVRINLEVPRLLTAEGSLAAEGLDQAGVAVRVEVSGPICCTLLVLLEEASARKLTSMLLGGSIEEAILIETEHSALTELVNISLCSFLGAMASLLHTVLIPAPPVAERGQLDALMQVSLVKRPQAVAIGSRFADEPGSFCGHIAVLADDASTRNMLGALGVEG